jgi:hypothetical protein
VLALDLVGQRLRPVVLNVCGCVLQVLHTLGRLGKVLAEYLPPETYCQVRYVAARCSIIIEAAQRRQQLAACACVVSQQRLLDVLRN